MKTLKLEKNLQSWTNVNNSNKFNSWKMKKRNGSEQASKNEKEIVKNIKQLLKKEKNSISGNRFWCWKNSSKVIWKHFWNAKKNSLLKKTVKIEE